MKKSLLLFFLLVATLIARADEGVKTLCLVVHTTDGSTVTYALPDKPVLSYEGATLVVTTDAVTANYPLADIERLDFEEVEIVTSLQNVLASGRIIKATRGGARLMGFAAGTEVRVYGSDGKLLRTARTNAEGSLDLNLQNEPTGIYMIQAEKSTLKIKK